jgi:hypothetical protein
MACGNLSLIYFERNVHEKQDGQDGTHEGSCNTKPTKCQRNLHWDIFIV